MHSKQFNRESQDKLSVLMIPDYTEVNPYQQELKSNLEVYDINVSISDTVRPFAILGAIWKEGVPDIVHLHWLHAFTIGDSRFKSLAGGIRLISELFILKLLNITIVWTIHNVYEHKKRTPSLEKIIKHFVIKLCDCVIVHCPRAREMSLEAYHLPQEATQKFKVIPHGNYIDSYRNDQTQSEARAIIGGDLDESQVVYLFFGHIRRYKNVPGLINNFKKIDESDARLLIVGNPRDKREARKVRQLSQSDQRIQFIFKFVPDDEIQYYMNAADVVVLPFEEVLTSGSALLAMSFKKALIAPRIGCVDEFLDSKGGFVYESEDENGLLKAMEQALNADLKAMGKYNYRKAKQFDWETIAKHTKEAYERHDKSP